MPLFFHAVRSTSATDTCDSTPLGSSITTAQGLHRHGWRAAAPATFEAWRVRRQQIWWPGGSLSLLPRSQPNLQHSVSGGGCQQVAAIAVHGRSAPPTNAGGRLSGCQY
uniref:Uncharacterized protein n=1 Tax=Oryza punctata TaxID=4537 RepID=A0A0E0LHJ8_ORYPU